MSEDIKDIPTSELSSAGAFRRARNGCIILTILTVSYVIQTVVFYFQVSEAYPDLWQSAQSDFLAYDLMIQLYLLLVIAGFSLILMSFAWFMRSRVAMWLGFLLFAVNWFGYISLWMAGDFEISGLLLNILGPFFLFKGVMAAQRYHSQRRISPELDTSVFE